CAAGRATAGMSVAHAVAGAPVLAGLRALAMACAHAALHIALHQAEGQGEDHPARSTLSSSASARSGLPREARVSKRTRASKLASATVASSSISLLTLMELARASAFRRSCLSSGRRMVRVDMGTPPDSLRA